MEKHKVKPDSKAFHLVSHNSSASLGFCAGDSIKAGGCPHLEKPSRLLDFDRIRSEVLK